MKARMLIGDLIVGIGVATAIGIADGNAHETLIRGIGVAMIIIGAYLAKAFDFQNKES